MDRVQDLHGSMFYTEPLDVAPDWLQSLVDILNDAASFRPRDPEFLKLCGGFQADYAVECGDRLVLLCFGCGEAKLVTSEAYDHVDLASGVEDRLRTLLAIPPQSRPPQQFGDPGHLDPEDLEQE